MNSIGRMESHTGGLLPELAAFLAATQAYHDETERMAEAGELGDVNVLNWLFSLGPNLVASAIDEGYEFDENRTYATYLVEKGVPWGVAGVLGSVLDILEPGPGEFKAAAKGITSAAASLPLLLRNLPSEETLFRLQNRLTGRGPFWDLPNSLVARGNRTGRPAQYFTGESQYLDSTIRDMHAVPDEFSVDPDQMEVVFAAPRLGSRTLDTTQTDVEAMMRLLDVIRANDTLPGGQRDFLIREFEGAIASGDPLDQSEALRSLALIGGFDRLGAPHEVGIDRLLQFPDDNYAASRLLGSVRPTESVVFNPNAIEIQGSMTPEEFLARRAEGTLPRATRAFPLAELVADAKAGGFTFDPRTGARPGRGFAFSEHPEIETIVPVSEFSEQHLADFINRNAHLLEDPEHFIGAWLDGDNVYLDISTIVDDLDEALRRGYAAKQLAVFDLGNFRSIDTGYRR